MDAKFKRYGRTHTKSLVMAVSAEGLPQGAFVELLQPGDSNKDIKVIPFLRKNRITDISNLYIVNNGMYGLFTHEDFPGYVFGNVNNFFPVTTKS